MRRLWPMVPVRVESFGCEKRRIADMPPRENKIYHINQCQLKCDNTLITPCSHEHRLVRSKKAHDRRMTSSFAITENFIVLSKNWSQSFPRIENGTSCTILALLETHIYQSTDTPLRTNICFKSAGDQYC